VTERGRTNRGYARQKDRYRSEKRTSERERMVAAGVGGAVERKRSRETERGSAGVYEGESGIRMIVVRERVAEGGTRTETVVGNSNGRNGAV
jgi:hypothetical protein